MSERSRPRDNATVYDIYCNCTTLGIAEIRKIFQCGTTKASKLKAAALEQQKKEGLATEYGLDTICAYKAWGINIKDVERRVMKSRHLAEAGT